MITGINELKALTKHIPCNCKCNFDGRKCNSIRKMGAKIQKNIMYMKKIISGIVLHVVVKMK